MFAYERTFSSQGSYTATILASTLIARSSALLVVGLLLLIFICRIFNILVSRAYSRSPSYKDVAASVICRIKLIVVNALKDSMYAGFAFYRAGLAFV